jgi:hypothetical protein
MGAGFDTVGVPDYPAVVRFSVAAVLKVPWADTNRRFPLVATLETTDGDALDWRMEGEMEAGRAPGSRPGDVTVVIAGPVQFQADDDLDLIARLRFAHDERTTSVRVMRAQTPTR